MVVLPQKVPAPLAVTAEGAAFTVTTDVTTHDAGVVYETVVVPAVRPANTPDVALIVPTDVVLLLQVPPVTEFDNDKVLPAQTEVPPVMGAVALTVIIALELQPDDVIV